jgi:hypothetical protein
VLCKEQAAMPKRVTDAMKEGNSKKVFELNMLILGILVRHHRGATSAVKRHHGRLAFLSARFLDDGI